MGTTTIVTHDTPSNKKADTAEDDKRQSRVLKLVDDDDDDKMRIVDYVIDWNTLVSISTSGKGLVTIITTVRSVCFTSDIEVLDTIV